MRGRASWPSSPRRGGSAPVLANAPVQHFRAADLLVGVRSHAGNRGTPARQPGRGPSSRERRTRRARRQTLRGATRAGCRRSRRPRSTAWVPRPASTHGDRGRVEARGGRASCLRRSCAAYPREFLTESNSRSIPKHETEPCRLALPRARDVSTRARPRRADSPRAGRGRSSLGSARNAQARNARGFRRRGRGRERG